MRILHQAARELYEYLVFYVALAYFGISGLLYTVLSVILYPLLPRRFGMRLGRVSIGLLFRGYLAMLRASGVMRLDLGALDALRAERSLIVAPNHPSLLDAVLVISRLPDIACIMKAEIWDSPVLGGGARLAGYIRNDSPADMVRLATGELLAGQRLLVFPEGTRTRAGTLNEFRGGFALIAKRSGAPVQTVFIETNSRFLAKGWPILRKPPMPLSYRVRLGRRFRAGDDAKAFVNELERYYRQELEAPSPMRPAALAGETRDGQCPPPRAPTSC
jgi:1-acyl-sn-glycerol-3-phosphate acyltransferase